MGRTSMTKRDFWKIFYVAWSEVMTLKNIQSAFTATGIHPLNPSKVISQIKQPSTPPEPSHQLTAVAATPTTARGVRRLIKTLHKEQFQLNSTIERVVHAAERLVFEKEILKHQNKAYEHVIIHEKKRRQRGKPMGLFNKDQPSTAQFFSPTKVAEARKQHDELETQKEETAAKKAHDKLQQAILRDEKATQLAEQKAAREEARLQAKQQQEADRAAKQASRLADKQAREARKAQEALEREKAKQAKQGSSKRKRRVKSTSHTKTPSKEQHFEDLIQPAYPIEQLPTNLPIRLQPAPTVESNVLVAASQEGPKATISRSGRTIRPSARLRDNL